MKKLFYILMPLFLLLAFCTHSCDDEDQLVNEKQVDQVKSTNKPKEKNLSDLFTSRITDREKNILNAEHKKMLTECIFKYIDEMLSWRFPYFPMGKLVYKPDFTGVIGLSQNGDLVINSYINDYNSQHGFLLMPLKHEFIHLFQIYFCGTQLFGGEAGMAEFEAFVFLDILQRIEDKKNNTTTTGGKHEWALHTAYNFGNPFYQMVAQDYLDWLDKLTNEGTTLPPASAIKANELAKHSNYFGEYNSYYSSGNTNYTFGDNTYDPCTLQSLLTYMNNYCR